MEYQVLLEWVFIPFTLLVIAFVTLLLAVLALRGLSRLIDWVGLHVVDGVLKLFPWATRRWRRRLWGLFLIGLLAWTIYHLRNLSAESPVVGAFLEEVAKLVWMPLVAVLVVGGVCWASSPSQVLFYHRYVKPLRQGVEALRSSVLMLGRVPLLGGSINDMRGLILKIKVRFWRGLLIFLFYLSIFTFPVQIFPLIKKDQHDLVGYYLSWPFQQIPWLTKGFATQAAGEASEVDRHFQQIPSHADQLGHFYLLLVDWILLVALCYAIATNLSRLSRQDLFDSVAEAVGYYITDLEIEFQFGAYFWRAGHGKFELAFHSPEHKHSSPWIPFALELHDETERLDEHLRKTWQGSNSRVAAVFTSPAGEEPARAFCFHYHRFGSYGFVVAVDDEPARFADDSGQSQDDFQQLVRGIGQLVNIRESLK